MRLNKLSNYGLKLYLQSKQPPRQLIAFDIGSRHTGCAISCLNLKKSYFLKNIKIMSKLSSDDFNQFYTKLEGQMLTVIKQNKPTALIFGIPQNMVERQYYQHTQMAMRTIIQGFADRYKLKGQQNEENVINYTFVDESWTTHSATQSLKEIQKAYAKWGHLHKQKQLKDGFAAMKILQKFLTYYNTP